MAGLFGSLRRRILTPSINETRLSTRGFHEKSPEARELLETIGASFLTGYGYAAAAARPEEAEQELEQVPSRFRGFAYEGAGMGFAVRDGLPVGGGRHVEHFLQGRGGEHVYMVYVGVGWAMARVPRFRWKALYTADPLLRWLALDGYGFHQAYFRTDRYVRRQYQESNFPWPGPGWSAYPSRVIDQGIGRAMWFVAGTDTARVSNLIESFAEERRPDLYSGAGLAATYAGGVGAREMSAFWDRAGKHRRQLAQGAAFGASARVETGLANEHTELATELFCGTTPEQASRICREARPTPVVDGDVPAYEAWRLAIADRLADHAEV